MKNIFYKSAFLSLLLLLAACNDTVEPSENEESTEEHSEEEGSENFVELTEEQFQNTDIEIGKAEMRSLGSEISVNGVIDVPPQGNVSVSIPYGGFLKATEMLPGTRIKKGQLLATVENPEFVDFQQEYLENIAEAEFLKSDFERQQTLYEEQVSSARVFQEAQSRYNSNQATIKGLESKLRLIGFNTESVRAGNVSSSVNIYSPVKGSVREVHTNVGRYIEAREVVMDLTDAEDLHVELNVYENDIKNIEVGQKIRFTLANEPDTWRDAEVYLIGSGVREDRSITIHGHLEEVDESLLPGMFVNARIETGASEGFAVPTEAVVRFDSKQYVFVHTGKRMEDGEEMYDFEMLEVRKGSSEAGYTQISLVENGIDLQTAEIVTKDANALLAAAKNMESEGGHGH